ncbi:Mg2+ transporter [Fusarium denticulatum]|uniref:Mg2+ transporter n=1 Tax=Fusarium denticulatum TaxID=48507 RepID=A0A8H5XDV4_9HYPO|nr:Mg2+ transporter [Fusarium denticulatum]
MSDFSNEIDREIAAASWEQSPEVFSSAPTSNSADRQLKEIQTRISTGLVSWYALCRLGYEFIQEGDNFVISGVLGPIDLEELFRYSERYQEADEQDQGSRPSVQLPNERVPLGLEDGKPAHSARIAPCSPTPSSFHTHSVAPSDTKDSVMRPWVNQLLVSDTVHLGDVKKQPRGSRGGQRSSDTYNAWGLVADSPFLCLQLKCVALSVIRELMQKHAEFEGKSPQLNTGTVLRQIGRSIWASEEGDLNGTQDTEPVVFLSTPFLALPKMGLEDCTEKIYTRTLLEFLYGFKTGGVQETSFSNSTSGGRISNLSRILEMPEALFLMIGGGTLISSSMLSWEQMMSGTVSLDISSEIHSIWPVVYRARITSPEIYIIIEEDCSYSGKEFRQLVFKSLGNYDLDIDDFNLVDENEHGVDSTTWLGYLTSGEVERHSFKLVRISGETSSKVPRDPGSEAFNDIENQNIEETIDEERSDKGTFERTMEAAKQMFCQSIGKGTLVRNMPSVLPTLPSMPFNNSVKNHIPFFAWPLNQKTGNSSHTDGTMALTRLLVMIDQSLKEFGITKDFHAFSTRDEVVYKCRVLQSVIEEGVYVPTQEAKGALPYRQPPSSNHLHRNPGSEILATLLALSEDIFDHFLPPANWFLVPAIGAYWGALDSIMRSIKRSNGHRLWQGVASRARTHNLESKLKCQLEDARRDVMMASETQIDTDRLTISPIGLEFLLITLLRNLHDHPIYPETNQKLDVVRHCRDKSTTLRFAAVRDPRRCRFLEISALEEEMEALRIIFEVQTRTVKAFAQVLSPDFFPKDTTDRADLGHRKDMYGLEKRHLDTHIQSLAEDGKTLDILQRILTATRHDMKQMIEVLDEGHGKAIRVFTFVTLFFLPLSFVTSFLGMNTTDVRELDRDQRIFWSSAVPLTLAVSILALVFGYRWDTVTALFFKAFKIRDSSKVYEDLEKDLTSQLGAENAGTSCKTGLSSASKPGTSSEFRIERRWKRKPWEKRLPEPFKGLEVV